MTTPFHPADHAAGILAALIDASDDAVVTTDLDGTIVSWSASAARLYGYPPSEAIGRSLASLSPTGGETHLADELARIRAGHRVVQFEVARRTRDGRAIAVFHTLSPVRDAAGAVIGAVSVARDLRNEKQKEDALRASEARWQAVINSAVDAIVLITDRGLVETFNPAAERLFGYSASEVFGRNVSVLMPSPYQEEHDSYLARYLREGAARIIGIGREVTGRRKDGSTFPLHLSVGEMAFRGEQRFVGILHDLSERVRMEGQLREQAALARLGEMAAVIAHEVKNPLAGIRGAIQVIGGRLPPGSREAGITHEIVTRIDALSGLMRDLLLFARPPQPRPSVVEIPALVASIVDLLREDPALADVRVVIDGTAPPIQADPELLKIVFLNLLINAAHAMQGRGTISVVVSDGGHSCLIAISDQGAGIPLDIREKIFTPFFTTKTRGSGLGLPTARQIIDAHRGEISIACPEAGGGKTTRRGGFFASSVSCRSRIPIFRAENRIPDPTDLLAPVVQKTPCGHGERRADDREGVMAERSEHVVLNHLIESCRDGERGFRLAAERITDPELKALFSEVADQRAAFARELLPYAQRMGGDAPAEGSAAAALHRGWIDLADTILHSNDKLLREVQRGDGVTLVAYGDAVNGMLPPQVREVVQRQYAAIEQTHARIPASPQKE